MVDRKNVLVLGGAGFVGAHLSERLLRDYNVICVDSFFSSGESNINHLLRLPNFEFVKHDMSEPLDLENNPELAKFQVNVFGISEIYNLACPMSVKNFEKLRIETVRANTLGMINSLELARQYKAKYLQFSSSVIYGNVPRGEFVDEKFMGTMDLLDPRAGYDEGKRYAESIVDTYRQAYNLDTKIVRIFRTYGPRMLLGDGQMIPDFILNALENKDLVVYGDDSFQTCLCYVGDIVEGCISAMNSSINDPINLGSADVYKIVDVAKKIIELTGSSSKIVFEGAQLFMRELALPDINFAKENLGWFPIVTLADGLQKTVDFTRAHKDLLTFSKDI